MMKELHLYLDESGSFLQGYVPKFILCCKSSAINL